MAFILGKKSRLSITIGISFCFFVAEITGPYHHSLTQSTCWVLYEHPPLTLAKVAFKTRSLALLADAFHYVR